MPDTLSSDAREILDAHLDAVEAALATAGQPRNARKSIIDDLEAQILEMLAEHTGNRVPETHDVEAVLAKMDPPQAYATGRAVPATSRPRSAHTLKPRRDWPRALALVCLIVGGLLLILWPTLAGVLAERAGAQLLAQRPDLTSISLTRGEIGNFERFGFWATGTLMLLGSVAAIIAWIRERP